MRVHRDWLLTPERAAIHLPTATAVIADLHLGYSEARRHSGEAVPVPSMEIQLAPLGQALNRHEVRRLVIAGDLFEKAYCPNLADELRRWLGSAGVELVAVVPGNHDRRLADSKSALPVCLNGYELDYWLILHGDGELPEAPIVHGHFHPGRRWRGRTLPCYLVGPRKLVLPAFSLDARGVNVRNEPAWKNHRCYCIAEGRVVEFGALGDPDGSKTRHRAWKNG